MSSVGASSKKTSMHQTHEEEDHKVAKKYANVYDVYLLGITIVIGGQLFSWNFSLAAGYWEAFLGLMTTGFLYLSLIICIAEMTSALPFSGGSYGFVRVCLGPFFGYLVGCCETLQNIAYVASAVIPFAEMVTIVFDADVKYEPIYWTFFFITAIGINTAGGHVFWQFSRWIGIISLLIILLYIGAAAQYGDFDKWAGPFTRNYEMNMDKFITNLPVCAWYFIGVESLPLSCVDCNEPSTEIPYGMIACMLTLFLTAIGVFFTTTSQDPGIDELSGAFLPLNPGFMRAFGLTDQQVTWLALPATYATGFGFMFIYGRQMCSMARSGLFPSVFRLRTSETRSPYVALWVGSALAVLGMVVVYYVDLTYLGEIFFLCILCSNYIYSSVFLCYIIFKLRYKSMQRKYSNNTVVGIVAAVYGIGYCMLSTASVLAYQVTSDKELPLTIFACYMGILLVYYYFFGYSTQKLSEEEQKVMFEAYVINANAMKRKKTKAAGGGSVISGARSNNDSFSTHGGEGTTARKGANDNKDHAGMNFREMAQRRRSSVASIPEGLLDGMDESGKVDDENRISTFAVKMAAPPAQQTNTTTTGDIEENAAKENAHSAPEPVARSQSHDHHGNNNHQEVHHDLPAMNHSHRPMFSNRVLPFEYTSSKKVTNTGLDGMAHAHHQGGHHNSQKLLTRSSITQSISERLKEIVHEIKLVPFMSQEEREDYEVVVLADCCGKLQDNNSIDSSRSIGTGTATRPEDMDDAENQLMSIE